MRRAALVLAVLTVLGAPACSHDSRSATWEPGAPGSPAPATPDGPGYTGPRPAFTENPDGTLNRSGGPQPSAAAVQLSAGGLGPYKIGVSAESLQAAKLITAAAPAAGCANYTTARGTSKYHSPDLVFFKGRLLHLTVSSSAVKTDKGIKIGSPLANVKGGYPNGKVLNDWSGASAWLAMTGDYALLFPLKNDKVAQVQAGMAEPIQFKYTDNQGC
ncbi:MAG: hypothetical protein QOE51_2718 [Actinoplanes sp.]|jgi:hypothetical protein|nr:hypothetical protein [Actinoplanes sp.]